MDLSVLVNRHLLVRGPAAGIDALCFSIVLDIFLDDQTDDWNSKKGKYAANVTTLQARARHVRNFLRSRPEKSIVLVAHGDILRYIVFGEQNATPWSNAEVRKYTFVDEDGEEAWLKVLETEAKEGHEEPTSSEAKEGKA